MKTNYEAFKAGFTLALKTDNPIEIAIDLKQHFAEFIAEDSSKRFCGRSPISIKAINPSGEEVRFRTLQDARAFFDYKGSAYAFNKRYVDKGTHVAGICEGWNLETTTTPKRKVRVITAENEVRLFDDIDEAKEKLNYKSKQALSYALAQGQIKQGKFQNWRFDYVDEYED